MRGFPFDRLKQATTVAINEAAVRLPWATALFSLDGNWIQRRRAEIVAFTGEKYLAPPGDVPRDLPDVVYLERSRAAGLSDDPNVLCMGGNSGYAALNLAYLKGAKEIVLLGYDFCVDREGRHWHEEYHWRSDFDQRYYGAWAANFRSTLPQLNRAGVVVLNASLESRVDAFPKVSLQDIV